jgi:hypothetical protein
MNEKMFYPAFQATPTGMASEYTKSYFSNYTTSYYSTIGYMKQNASSTLFAKAHDIYSFCDTTSGSCSIINLKAYDNLWSQPSYAVNSFSYQLPNGHCHDTVSIPEESFFKLSSVPFVPLTAEYINCHLSLESVAKSQAGIAASNVGTVLPFLISFIIFLTSIYEQLSGHEVMMPYNRLVCSRAVDNLAKVLLLHRDRKVEDLEKPKQPEWFLFEEGHRVKTLKWGSMLSNDLRIAIDSMYNHQSAGATERNEDV